MFLYVLYVCGGEKEIEWLIIKEKVMNWKEARDSWGVKCRSDIDALFTFKVLKNKFKNIGSQKTILKFLSEISNEFKKFYYFNF